MDKLQFLVLMWVNRPLQVSQLHRPSTPPLNLEQLKEDKAIQFAAEVTNRFTALAAAQNEVTVRSVSSLFDTS